MKRAALVALTAISLYGCGGGGGLADVDVNYEDFGVNVAVRSSPYLTPENHEDGWGRQDCLICHQKFKHTMATPHYSAEEYQSLIDRAVEKVGITNAIMVCSACHGTNGVESATRSCLVCHDGMDKLHFYAGTSTRSRSLHDFNADGKIGDKECLVCHWQPDMDGIVEPSTDFGAPSGIQPRTVNELCLSCHSLSGAGVFSNPVADTNGDGSAEETMSPAEAPPAVKLAWESNDWHGGNNYSGEKPFESISLSGELLYHSEHAPLICSQCHNPHASNNDSLIIERVGETLVVEKLIIQTDNTSEYKYALVDPQTLDFFSGLEFEGIVETSSGSSYDLSNKEELKAFSSLPVKNINDEEIDVQTAREYTSSLCAACHAGSYSSPVNNLTLPVDIKTHGDKEAKCTACHIHGQVF